MGPNVNEVFEQLFGAISLQRTIEHIMEISEILLKLDPKGFKDRVNALCNKNIPGVTNCPDVSQDIQIFFRILTDGTATVVENLTSNFVPCTQILIYMLKSAIFDPTVPNKILEKLLSFISFELPADLLSLAVISEETSAKKLKLLLDHNPEFGHNFADTLGKGRKIPFCQAVENGDEEKVLVLVSYTDLAKKYAFFPYADERWEQTPMQRFIQYYYGRREKERLLSCAKKICAIPGAGERDPDGFFGLISLLLEEKPEVDVALVTSLLKKVKKEGIINRRSRPPMMTRLHWALEQNDIDWIREGASAGFDVNFKGERGYITPLDFAVSKDCVNVETLRVLLATFRADIGPDDCASAYCTAVLSGKKEKSKALFDFLVQKKQTEAIISVFPTILRFDGDARKWVQDLARINEIKRDVVCSLWSTLITTGEIPVSDDNQAGRNEIRSWCIFYKEILKKALFDLEPPEACDASHQQRLFNYIILLLNCIGVDTSSAATAIFPDTTFTRAGAKMLFDIFREQRGRQFFQVVGQALEPAKQTAMVEEIRKKIDTLTGRLGDESLKTKIRLIDTTGECARSFDGHEKVSGGDAGRYGGVCLMDVRG